MMRKVSQGKDGKFYKSTKRFYENLPETHKWVKEFFISGHVRGMTVDFSEGTKKGYEKDLDKFFSFVKKEYNLVNERDVKNYYRQLRSEGYSKITLSRMMHTVKGYFRFLVGEKVISETPFKDVKLDFSREMHNKFMEISKQILDREEVDSLLGSFKNPRDSCLFSMMYGLGLRISEALNLSIYDIDIDRGKATIDGKGDKKREVDLKPCLIKRINLWLMVRGKQNTDKLFITVKKNALTYDAVRKKLWDKCIETEITKKIKICDECLARERKIKELQGKSTSRKIINEIKELQEKYNNCKLCGWHKHITPHSLRHTFITHAIEDGIPVPEVGFIVGHSSLSMTMNYCQLAQLEKSYRNKFRDF